MRELRTLAEFRAALTGREVLLITDSANKDCLHRPPCGYVTEENFERKVIRNGGKNGRYFVMPAGEAPTGTRRCRCY